MLPDTAPLPVAARFTAGTPDRVTVKFDVKLTPGFLTFARWTGRFNDRGFLAVSAIASGNVVNLGLVDNGVNAGIDQVSYDDGSQDLRSFFQDIPAVSFTDFPIT